MERYLPQLSERSRRWVRFAGLIAIVWLLAWLTLWLSSVVTPIVAALAVAYVLNPLVTWLEKRRNVSRVISVSVLLGLIVGFAALIIVAGTIQLIEFADSIEAYARQFITWLNETFPSLMTSPSSIEPSNLAKEYGAPIGRTVYAWASAILSNMFYGLTVAVLLPLYTFFFLLRFNEIVHAVVDHIPVTYRPLIVSTAQTIDRAISNFFRGRLMVCTIVGLLNALGWLIIGLKHSLLLGAVAGVLNLVPFMSILVLPPALILAFVNVAPGQPWVVAVALAMGVYLVVQAIESFALTPLIESKSSGLHPVTTVIALLVGGKLAGLLGMLLAIPIASTLKSLGIQYLLPEIRRLAEHQGDQPAPGTPESGSHQPAQDTETSSTDTASPQDKA